MIHAFIYFWTSHLHYKNHVTSGEAWNGFYLFFLHPGWCCLMCYRGYQRATVNHFGISRSDWHYQCAWAQSNCWPALVIVTPSGNGLNLENYLMKQRERSEKSWQHIPTPADYSGKKTQTQRKGGSESEKESKRDQGIHVGKALIIIGRIIRE